jgi:phosphosulfolactate phosphohydrolase-like enzyme
MEDALCAGRIVRRVRERVERLSANDAAVAAVRLAARPVTAAVLARTVAGRRLAELGRGEDVAFCAVENHYEAVPEYDEHRIRL